MLKNCVQGVKKRKESRRIPRFEGMNSWQIGASTTGLGADLQKEQVSVGEKVPSVVGNSVQDAC